MAGDHLNNDTEDINGTADDNSPFTTNSLCHISGSDGAKEGSGREDGDDERVVGRGEGGLTRINQVDEHSGAGDTIDISRVITEEDTTKGRKGADEVRLPGDGGLNHLDIVGMVEASNETWLGGSRHGNRSSSSKPAGVALSLVNRLLVHFDIQTKEGGVEGSLGVSGQRVKLDHERSTRRAGRGRRDFISPRKGAPSRITRGESSWEQHRGAGGRGSGELGPRFSTRRGKRKALPRLYLVRSRVNTTSHETREQTRKTVMQAIPALVRTASQGRHVGSGPTTDAGAFLGGSVEQLPKQF